MFENPQRKSAGGGAELPVILKSYDFILWSCQKTEKFPRSHKYALGSRIQQTGFEMLELLIDAKFRTVKLDLLVQAGTVVEKLRFMFRMAKDLRLISLSSHRFAAQHLQDIGRQLAGWKSHEISKGK